MMNLQELRIKFDSLAAEVYKVRVAAIDEFHKQVQDISNRGYEIKFSLWFHTNGFDQRYKLLITPNDDSARKEIDGLFFILGQIVPWRDGVFSSSIPKDFYPNESL